jgi:S1-C subfamily serine protease
MLADATFPLAYQAARRTYAMTRRALTNRRCGNVRGQIRALPAGAVLVAVLGVALLGGGPSAAYGQHMKPETLERVKEATVMVWTAASRSQKGDTKLGSGSGYFINSTGLLITNNHVVDPGHGRTPAEKWQILNQYNLLVYSIITDSGTEDEKERECKLLYSNEKADQALVQALDEDGEKLETPSYLRFMPESRLKERLKVVGFGFPGGDSRVSQSGKHPEINVVEGHVLDLPRTPAGRVRRIYTDAEARAGNSGGPFVNTDGLLVGTLTLGFADGERRNYNALVPAALTKDFIKGAFDLGKVPAGHDLIPFVEMLTQENGRINLPEFDRRPNDDIIFLENGDRIYGQIATDKITWNSPLGTVDVPTSAIAYVITGDEGAHLFLEGGNRLDASEVASTFQFTPIGGTASEFSFDDVHVVAFKTEDRKFEPLRGVTRTLDADAGRLVLKDVQGEAAFETQLGNIKIPFEQIERIELREEDEEQVLITRNGRRMSGQFGDTAYEGIIAATAMPVKFHLADVSWAMVDKVNNDLVTVKGLNLAGLFTGASRRITNIVEILASTDPSGALPRIEELLAKDTYNTLTDEEKDQVRLLSGVAQYRTGNFQQAEKELRRVASSVNENVAAYAAACAEVFKRYPNYKYKGKSLSDRAVFAEAGVELAETLIEDARSDLRNIEREVGNRDLQLFLLDANPDKLQEGILQAIAHNSDLEDFSKAVYPSGLIAVGKHERLIRVASILGGEEADYELNRLRNAAVNLCKYEYVRLYLEEVKERQEESERTGRGGSGRSRRTSRSRGRGTSVSPLQRALDEIQEQREKLVEVWGDYFSKLDKEGFIIQDPDLQDEREREPDDEGP